MVLLIVIKLLSRNAGIFFLEYAKDLCIFVIKVVCLIKQCA